METFIPAIEKNNINPYQKPFNQQQLPTYHTKFNKPNYQEIYSVSSQYYQEI